MKSRVRLAILRILSLREEFSETDLSEAVEIISEGKTENLLAWLTERQKSTPRKTSKNLKQIDKYQSKAVIELRDKEPELYKLLHELDGLLRRGVLLPRLEDIRKIGGAIDKNFEAGKSRKDAIPRLMDVLAIEPIDRVQELLQWMLNISDASEKETEYHKLATFLIRGK